MVVLNKSKSIKTNLHWHCSSSASTFKCIWWNKF